MSESSEYHWNKFYESLISPRPIYELPEEEKMTIEEAMEFIEVLMTISRATMVIMEDEGESIKLFGRTTNEFDKENHEKGISKA